VHASRYAAGSWSAEADVAPSLPGNASNPSIGLDSAGNAVAAWIQVDGGPAVYANRYAVGAGWGEPVLVSSDVGSISIRHDTVVAARPNGDAVVIYSTGSPPKITAAFFSADAGWGAEQVIDTPTPIRSGVLSQTTFINTRTAAVCWASPTSAIALWSHTPDAGAPVNVCANTLH